MYKSSTRLQLCARAATSIRATKIRIPSQRLHAHSGLLASPVALSRFEAAVIFNTPVFSSPTHPPRLIPSPLRAVSPSCGLAKARYFSDGQNGEIHSVSAPSEIPMHGGASDLAAGLNHVMRAPRGSECLSEKIDFTPKGRGGAGGERREGRGAIQVVE